MNNPYDYYITDEEYEIAEKNGISRDTLNFRIRRMGWDKERALTTPTRKYTKRGKQIEIAESNGIGRTTFYDRLADGWKVEDAYTVPVMNRQQILEKMWKERDRKRYENGKGSN